MLDQWIADKGYIDYSTIDFAPDSTPLEIERLINNDMVGPVSYTHLTLPTIYSV